MEQDVRRELVINPQVRFHDYKNTIISRLKPSEEMFEMFIIKEWKLNRETKLSITSL